MSKNKNLTPSAKDALYNFKMETARELGVNLKQGYNGDLTSRQAGSIGGSMVKKLVEQAANNMNPSAMNSAAMNSNTNMQASNMNNTGYPKN